MAAAPATARRAAPARSAPDSGRSANRRAPLRVVSGARAERPRLGRLMTFLPVAMIVGALLFVVVGQAMLANGQVRLANVQQQLSVEQGVHRQQELAVSRLETPARIVTAASGQLHMMRPSTVVQLPYVALSTPIATPDVTAVPAPPTTSPASSSAQ